MTEGSFSIPRVRGELLIWARILSSLATIQNARFHSSVRQSLYHGSLLLVSGSLLCTEGNTLHIDSQSCGHRTARLHVCAQRYRTSRAWPHWSATLLHIAPFDRCRQSPRCIRFRRALAAPASLQRLMIRRALRMPSPQARIARSSRTDLASRKGRPLKEEAP